MILTVLLALTAHAGKAEDTGGTKQLHDWLQSQDFEPNPGLSAQFLPGSVIQTHASKNGRNKSKELDAPLLFLRSEACFPGSTPESSEFVVPQGSGSFSGDVSTSVKGPKILPSLSVDVSRDMTWTLSVDNPRRVAFAKADLSQNFSQECLEKLTAAVNAGEQLGWFGTVTEAIMADAMVMTFTQATAMSAEAKLAFGQALGGALPSAKIATASESETSLTLRAEGEILIGYRFRRMAAVEE